MAFIFGVNPVMEALFAQKPLDKVFFQSGIRGDFEKDVRRLCRENDVPLQVVPREKLSRLVSGQHQGIVAALPVLEYSKLEDLIPMAFEKGETPLFVLLDGVTDVRNVGAIARSALLAASQGLVLPKTNSALLNEDAMKASAGALNHLPVCRENSLATAIDLLKLSGIQVVATALIADARPIFEVDFTIPTAILLGEEGDGINPAFLKRADVVAKIPQLGDFNSFNVSVAAGICLYEAMRQRMGAGVS